MNSSTVGSGEEVREKEAHIEQLMRERELERAEMARASQQCEKVPNSLSSFTLTFHCHAFVPQFISVT